MKRDDESGRDRLVEVNIVEQDVGRFAAELERDALHRRGAVAHNRSRQRATEPVNEILATSGLRTSSAPTMFAERPITTLQDTLGKILAACSALEPSPVSAGRSAHWA